MRSGRRRQGRICPDSPELRPEVRLKAGPYVLSITYVVHVPVMWRQAPITACIVVAGGLSQTKVHGLEQGVKRVGEVLLGCVVGLVVTFVMSKLWPVAPAQQRNG